MLRHMSTKEILRAIVVAKTGKPHVYRDCLYPLTKREAREQLDWFIRVAKASKGLPLPNGKQEAPVETRAGYSMITAHEMPES